MDYFILFLAVLCIAVQFNLNKLYQKKFAAGLKDILFFSLVCGAANTIFFGAFGVVIGGLPKFSTFSFVISILLAVVSSLSALVGILIMRYGKMSVYSVFMMLGGMILPYFYGIIFLDEVLSAARIIGLAVLICALPLSTFSRSDNKSRISKFYYILCVSIFLINGTVSIISKAHSINISAVPAVNFIFYSNLWVTVINCAAYFIFKPKVETPAKVNKLPAVGLIMIFAAVSGVGFLLQLISAKTVPAVVLYPFVTGGSIVLSTIGARVCFGEKINVFALIGIITAVGGTLLFLI
ncbi:MAG: hypothetical protein FWF15_03220 [Oscillospiraceae bacterium]|nr:hypothetical protein [Oscillospiraceae bacterium]